MGGWRTFAQLAVRGPGPPIAQWSPGQRVYRWRITLASRVPYFMTSLLSHVTPFRPGTTHYFAMGVPAFP